MPARVYTKIDTVKKRPEAALESQQLPGKKKERKKET